MLAVEDLARDTTAVVLAGGQGTRLGALTRRTCKPALPFGAAYRNIDFSLSNSINSGIRRVGIVTQHKPEALLQHVDAVWGRRLAGDGEYVAVWPAQSRAPLTGYRGTADAVFRNLDLIETERHRLVLVLAGDHVYRMDYRPMLEFHRTCGADVTVGCIDIAPAEASQFGILVSDAEGRVARFIEKPQSEAELPDADRVIASMGIYVFDAAFLAKALRSDAFATDSRHDFGGDILPALVRQARVFAYRFDRGVGAEPAYWRDVGTPEAYWRAHMELLDDAPSLRLDDPEWPLPPAWGMSAVRRRQSSRGAGSEWRSLIGGACTISGSVNRSVLFPGVAVATGSIVDSSVVLPGAQIGKNCRICGTIVDSGCRIPDGTVIGSALRGTSADLSQHPIVVTPDDFTSEPLRAYA
jgi:glucose-1-phosphate adenylyltransferase